MSLWLFTLTYHIQTKIDKHAQCLPTLNVLSFHLIAYTTRRPQSAASGQKWWIVLIVLLVLLIFIVPIIFFYRRVKNQRRETSEYTLNLSLKLTLIQREVLLDFSH